MTFAQLEGEAFLDYYDLVEPYILDRQHSLSEENLLTALIGFYNKNLDKRHDILDVLESTLINQVDNVGLHEVT